MSIPFHCIAKSFAFVSVAAEQGRTEHQKPLRSHPVVGISHVFWCDRRASGIEPPGRSCVGNTRCLLGLYGATSLTRTCTCCAFPLFSPMSVLLFPRSASHLAVNASVRSAPDQTLRTVSNLRIILFRRSSSDGLCRCFEQYWLLMRKPKPVFAADARKQRCKKLIYEYSIDVLARQPAQAQNWTIDSLRSTPQRRFMKSHANLKQLPVGAAKGLKVSFKYQICLLPNISQSRRLRLPIMAYQQPGMLY